MLKYSTDGEVLYSDDALKPDGKDMLDEDALRKTYRKALEGAWPRPLIVHMQQRIREYDISNQRLHTQLRALLRASVYGKLHILFSMISCMEEMVAAKMALAKAQQELYREGVAYREEIPLGIAVDTPSAALLADALAQECDFFIIDGQNLIRHSLASDYTDQQIKEYEALYTPSIFLLMKCAIDGAHKGGLPCGVWGEAFESIGLIPAWLGLGVNQWFMSKESIDRARKIIGQRSGESHQELASSLLTARTRSEVMEQLEAAGNPAVSAKSSCP